MTSNPVARLNSATITPGLVQVVSYVIDPVPAG
jgi:hypothetical protein